MNIKDFDKFCAKHAIVEYKHFFYVYLMAKYDNHVPDDVNLAAEWNTFIGESTSKAE